MGCSPDATATSSSTARARAAASALGSMPLTSMPGRSDFSAAPIAPAPHPTSTTIRAPVGTRARTSGRECVK